MTSHKLSTRVVRGVFVGYSTTQKRYHGYDPTSKHTCITKDALFYENTFFFLNISPSTVDSYPSLPNHHCDIWGPSSTSDLEGHRWFLVLIDDYNRFSWLHLLKQKCER